MTVEQHGVLRPSLTTDMDPISQQLVMGAAGSGGGEKLYVEDVFSTWLYTGNGSTQTITNGIDLSGKGGLVWLKKRNASLAGRLMDTLRGADKWLTTSGTTATDGQATDSSALTSFNSTGFSLGSVPAVNASSDTLVSWSFRKAAKFFDVVTYTGTGVNRTVAHNLGSIPGCIIVKRTDTAGDWQVYHRSLANTEYLVLNSTNAKATGATRWNSTTPTSTEFSLGTDATVNASGGTYVAYLFAHDAGGFGNSETNSIINCGGYTGNGSATGPAITLGWEPQWLLVKRTGGTTGDWLMVDVSRGLMDAPDTRYLAANTSTAEQTLSSKLVTVNPAGFQVTTTSANWNASGETFIYIAIRRGPMKTPTDATKVFNAVARTGTGANATVTCGFQADACFIKNRTAVTDPVFVPRLTGINSLSTTSNNPETSQTTTVLQANPWDVMDGIKLGTTGAIVNSSGTTYINYFFKRAPGFCDIATFTGTGAALSVNHNLGATPELMLVKRRNGTITDWQVYAGAAGEYLVLNSTAAKVSGNTDRWNNTAPTSSAFTVGTFNSVSTATYIAYLFASCPGVSKVGTYTGTATTLDINCGFTNGARFVLIKRTDTTGDWYYWDTARGIIAANDPYLLINSTAAEITNTDYIDPLSSGFQISSTAPAAINASGGTYLYLAIA